MLVIFPITWLAFAFPLPLLPVGILATVFVTAYRDRGAKPVPKAIRELAWGSFAWFMSEPDNLVQLHDAPPRQLKGLFP